MANYIERVVYLYPGIQGVMYWFTQSPDHNETGKIGQQELDGKEWTNPYDGLVWENKDIPKPLQKDLDALDDATVDTELANRAEVARKTERDISAKDDLALVALYNEHVKTNPSDTFSTYLDQVEATKPTVTVAVLDII